MRGAGGFYAPHVSVLDGLVVGSAGVAVVQDRGVVPPVETRSHPYNQII